MSTVELQRPCCPVKTHRETVRRLKYCWPSPILVQAIANSKSPHYHLLSYRLNRTLALGFFLRAASSCVRLGLPSASTLCRWSWARSAQGFEGHFCSILFGIVDILSIVPEPRGNILPLHSYCTRPCGSSASSIWYNLENWGMNLCLTTSLFEFLLPCSWVRNVGWIRHLGQYLRTSRFGMTRGLWARSGMSASNVEEKQWGAG